MERKTVLVIADLGGCPPHMFYKSAAEKYNLVSFIPRPFAITASHAALIEKYSVAVIKDKDYFKSLADFEHPDSTACWQAASSVMSVCTKCSLSLFSFRTIASPCASSISATTTLACWPKKA